MPNTDHEHQLELSRRIEQGDPVARREMIENNMGLVVHWANKFINRSDIDLDDLISEGTIGLIRAVEKFDWRKGFHFSTYATWWIRQALQRAVNDPMIYVPEQTLDGHKLLANKSAELTWRLGRAPTNEELEAETGMNAQKREWFGTVTRVSVSLDAPLMKGGDSTVGETLVVLDNYCEDPIETVELRSQMNCVRSAVERLPGPQSEVIRLYFGLDETPLSLADVGKRLKMSARTVQRVHRAALEVLRQDPELLGWEL